MAHKKKSDAIPQVTAPTDITPLSQYDGQRLQEMVELNNNYGALVKQKSQYDAAIKMLKIRREKIVKGEIALPVMIQISRNVSYAEPNKDKVLQHFDEEIRGLDMAVKGMTGTLEHRRDEYVECVIRVSKLLSEKVKDYQIKNITGVRTVNKDIENEEKTALEKEFNAVLKKETA
jgi:hypothetical protein